METLLFLGLLAILIVLNKGSHRINTRLGNLESEIGQLRYALEKFLSAKKEETSPQATVVSPREANETLAWERPKEVLESPPPIVESEPVSVLPEPNPTPQVAPSIPEPIAAFEEAIPPVETPLPPPEPRPTFFERHPDLESFIGEALIPKIGIAILVIAIGFFVKYAIDQNWIGAAGRVSIGILCGGILVGLAHRLQRSYGAFASVLVGGGLAVFYYSIALAYKDYHLFSQPVAFVITVIITAFAIALSLLYDRQVVGILALAGGFTAPFLVSNGSGNYIALFTYLFLLNSGLLVIAYRKNWRLLNALAFGATALLFAVWTATLPATTPRATFIGGLLFATVFYLLFLAINLAHNIKEQKRFIASDFGILLANNALYFAAGLYLLYGAHLGAYKGLFAAALGVLNYALAAVLLRRKAIDKTILYLLVGVTLTFVSLAAPLQLHGHFITLFWAAETIVLLFLFQKSRISVLQWGALLVWVCSLLSLTMDWSAIYGDRSLLFPVMINRGFITTVFVAVANGVLYKMLRREEAETSSNEITASRAFRNITGGCALVLLYAAGALEIAHQFGSRLPDYSLGSIYGPLYAMAFVGALLLLQRRNILRLNEGLLTGLTGLCLFIYLASLPAAYEVQTRLLEGGPHGVHFLAHGCSALLTVLLFYALIQRLRARKEAASFGAGLSWIGAAFAVIFVSVEVHFILRVLLSGPNRSLADVTEDYVRVGLPIVWGLCSFGLMWLGMRAAFRPLRIASLVLFSITLLKLFLFDIQKVGAAGKVAAFFSLGVLLLVVSFMYQRLKKLIISNEKDTKKADEDVPEQTS